MKKHSAFLLMLSMFFLVVAQGSITKSKIKQKLNGKEYYVHIVEHGQTVFSVSRAYGVKYYDAFIKNSVHHIGKQSHYIETHQSINPSINSK